METKSLFNSKIKEISQNGVEWLEPFQEFVNSAAAAAKIARAQKIVAMIYQSWQKLSARTSF